jgi:hypothetical protein
MNARTGNLIAVLAALLVIFTAMVDPSITVFLSLAGVVALVIYTLYETSRHQHT